MSHPVADSLAPGMMQCPGTSVHGEADCRNKRQHKCDPSWRAWRYASLHVTSVGIETVEAELFRRESRRRRRAGAHHGRRAGATCDVRARRRQRGRMGGRGGAGRGRRWCRGSGGGTKRKTCPQEGQFSEPTSSARIQFPFDSQDGFIHWTVDPGMSGMSTLLVWPSLTGGSESPEGEPTETRR